LTVPYPPWRTRRTEYTGVARLALCVDVPDGLGSGSVVVCAAEAEDVKMLTIVGGLKKMNEYVHLNEKCPDFVLLLPASTNAIVVFGQTFIKHAAGRRLTPIMYRRI